MRCSGSNRITALSQGRLIALFSALVIVLLVISLFLGTHPIPVFQALRESLGDSPSVYSLIVTEVRLPRA